MFLSKAQKLCGKRGHEYVFLVHTGECISGCVYCGAYSAKTVALATTSANVVETITRAAIVLCLLALSAVAVVCAVWLGAAL